MVSNKLVPYNVFIFHVDRKSKMTATIGHCLTQDPMRVRTKLFSETTNMLEPKLICQSVKTNLVWNWNQLYWINMNGIKIVLSWYGWCQDFPTKWA